MEKGLIQVYTGDGKGKTTAALGQAIRAIGHGKRVYVVQFLKSGHTGELNVFKQLEPLIKLFRFEKPRGFVWTLAPCEIEELKLEISEAFGFVKEACRKNDCDLIILDEIMGVLSNKLIELKDVIDFLKDKPEGIEVVLTGRNVPDEIVELADYVSKIDCIKHPFQKGIEARKGIEF